MRHTGPLLSTNGFADAFERHRGTLVALIVILSLGAVYGILHVPTSHSEEAQAEAAAPHFRRETQAGGATNTNAAGPGSGRARIPGRLPSRQYHQTTTECLLVAEVDDLFRPATVHALRHVARELETMPQISRVFWLDRVPNLNMFGWSEPLLPADSASPERFAAARERVMQHPLTRGQLISDDGKTLMFLVWLEWIHITDDDDATTDIITKARSVVADHPDANVRLRLTGRVPLYMGAQRALNRNHVKFQIIGYTLVLVLAVVLFRGIPAVVIVAGAPALGIFWSHGWLKLFDQLDNPLTGAVLPVLVSMVGFTDGVHLIVHIRASRAHGATPMEAAKSAIRKVGLACLLTSVTTAIGFGSLMLASNEYVRGFGRACSIGVMLTFIAVISFIPLVSTTRLGKNIHLGHERDFVRSNLNRLAPLIDWVIPRKWSLSVLSFVITLALLAWTLYSLRPDDRLSDSQPTGSEAYQALAHCDRVLGGIETIEIRVFWNRDVPVQDVLAAVDSGVEIFEDEELVNNPLSIHDFLSQLPGSNAKVARSTYLALLPEAIQENYFNRRLRRARVTGRVQDLGIAAFEPAFSRIEQRLEVFNLHHAGIYLDLHGSPVYRGRQLFQIVVDLATSLGTASIIILAVLAIVYQSLTVGLITIVPNLFPLVVTAAYLMIVGHALEIASVCAFTVCLGIAVDDSIHFLSRYQDERKSGKLPTDAIRATFIGVGTALITTTLVLIAGFGTVLTSDLPGHRTFAAMACWTIGAALVGDLIFLPALLLCADEHRQEDEPQAAEPGA